MPPAALLDVDGVAAWRTANEAAMARHVGSYFDEWKATLEDPTKLARFVSFVNAPGTPDPNISFSTERGQIRPAVADGPVDLGSTIAVGVP